jgi:hypothetical protein
LSEYWSLFRNENFVQKLRRVREEVLQSNAFG